MISIPERDIERAAELAETYLDGTYTIKTLMFDDGDASISVFHTLDMEPDSRCYHRQYIRLRDGAWWLSLERRWCGREDTVDVFELKLEDR